LAWSWAGRAEMGVTLCSEPGLMPAGPGLARTIGDREPVGGICRRDDSVDGALEAPSEGGLVELAGLVPWRGDTPIRWPEAQPDARVSSRQRRKPTMGGRVCSAVCAVPPLRARRGGTWRPTASSPDATATPSPPSNDGVEYIRRCSKSPRLPAANVDEIFQPEM